MVAKPGKRFSSANAGELSRDIAGRPDIRQYYSGGLAFKNIEPVPQSGFRLMPGSIDMGRVRGELIALTQGSPTTSSGPFSPSGTIYEADLTAAAAVTGVLVTGLSSSAGAFTFFVDVRQSNGTWQTILDTGMSGGTSAVTRLVAFAPGAAVEANRIRVRVTMSDTGATVALSSVTIYREGDQVAPRYRKLPSDETTGYFFAVGQNFADIFAENAWVACVQIPQLATVMLPDLDFYSEAATLGIFFGQLQTRRVRRAGSDREWTVDLWPYDGLPEVDLGGDYPKTNDIWEIFVRWTGDIEIYLSVTVNGEQAPAVAVSDSMGVPTTVGGAPDWPAFAAAIEAGINDLPSIDGGVTVTDDGVSGGARRLIIEFGGASGGAEYNLSAIVTNTSEASALPTHTQIGRTEGEPLFSTERGWPGSASLLQDRLAYCRIPARGGALALSEVAEYFRLNIAAQGANAPRLDALRSQTSEIIYRAKQASYFLVFTNLSVWFATNRTISQDEPLNFVLASEKGIQANTDPIELEGIVYYVSRPGRDRKGQLQPQQVLSLSYDDISTAYNAVPESLLSQHLVEGVKRTARQAGTGGADANRMWLLRNDGRLVAANTIRSQEISLAFCEWRIADGGKAREVGVDHFGAAWVAIEHDGELRHDRMDEDELFQGTVVTTTDLAGLVTGLHFADGTTVWADADGFMLGPFTVAGGAIDLGNPYETVHVGRWIAPYFESMPHVYVNQVDEVLRRPGRIHTAHINITDTTSLAVAANNGPLRDVALLETSDPADQPMPGKTKKVTVGGIMGMVEDTTIVISQLKPGRLRVRDFTTEERL